MARLNEPIVSTDTLETLRRKFLRQNRDIARTNSTQSLKIRSLENECARLLSENLELRGQVLHLQTELKGSHAQRVANHALQIKEKMEAQLVEWGAMLAGLGLEPIPRNRSPRALKKQKIQRNSLTRPGMSDWRRRETMSSMQDLEAAALQEGRLPPLWENKSYPRETLKYAPLPVCLRPHADEQNSREEILALRMQAEENTESPDLGPPPVSRILDEDPVKLDLSTLTRLLKPVLSESEYSDQEETTSKLKSALSSSSTHTVPEVSPKKEHKRIEDGDNEAANRNTSPHDSLSVEQDAKANLKRKDREDDERENDTVADLTLPPNIITKNQPEKATSAKAKSTNRPIKDLPSLKKEGREKPLNTAGRKPLGSKSTNQALRTSPKKSAKVQGLGEKSQAEGKVGNTAVKQTTPEPEPTVEISASASPLPIAVVEIEPESLTAESNTAVPDSPKASVLSDHVKDTPPPVDISSQGETTRGNRRARAAVSYAEPNLRDKMRRPNTKQLFDAVAGEGKNVRRTSTSKKDEPASGPTSAARSAVSSTSHQPYPLSPSRSPGPESQDADVLASPLVQKTTRQAALTEPPTAINGEGQKMTCHVDLREEETKSTLKGASRRLEVIACRDDEVAKSHDESDVYEINTSSIYSVSKDSTPEPETKQTKGNRQARSRRLSSMVREDLQPDITEPNEKAFSKRNAVKKRASMVAPKSAKIVTDDCPSVEGDSMSSTSTAEGDGTSRDKVSSRRRSMML
ncbi:hypothetical protein F5Y18DRAFT_100449 [Xylariaceae sp. FL1019]|nr:hypothetical protein F5Y18DRAFT_100449 [Xylariaceae sp. FL1019]